MAHNYPFTQYNDAKQALLSAVMLLAPTGAVQRRMVNLLHDMEDAGEMQSEIIVALLGAMLDGIKHGNWPQPAKREGN